MLILHVHPVISSSWLLDALAECTAAGIHIQSVSRASTALARVAGGGVDAILLDESGGHSTKYDEAIELLRREASQIPLLVAVSGLEPRQGPETAVTPQCASALPALLAEATQASRGASPAGRGFGRPPGAGLIALLGVKGGVGTSTLALNVAAALAAMRRVALVEMRPDFGVLFTRLRGPARRSGLELLLSHPAALLDRTAVESVLWAPEEIEQLRILSAPVVQPHPFTAAHAEAILNAVRAASEAVVADLSLDIREAARAAVTLADQVVLVAERTPACVAAVRMVRGELLAWGVSRDALCLAVVNRATVGAPVPLDRLEEKLEMPLLDVLPPDADGCCLCESLRRPMTAVQPECLLSDKYRSIARALANQMPQSGPPPAMRELAYR